MPRQTPVVERPTYFPVLHLSVKDQANRKMSGRKMSDDFVYGVLKFFDRGLAIEAAANLLGQSEPFDLHRGRAREIGVPRQIAVKAFEIEESVVTSRQIPDQHFGQLLTFIGAQDDDQLFAEHGSLRPDVIGREDAKLFYGQAIERHLYVFGIDVLALLGDDHIFDPTEKLQMALSVKSAQVARHQPPVDDRLRRQFGIVQVM